MAGGPPTHDSGLSRRGFLGLAGGVVLLAACGGDDDGAGPTTAADATAFTDLSPGVVSSDLYATPDPQRLAFAMLAKEGYASGGTARLAVAPPDEDPAEFVPTSFRGEGLPDKRGVYVAEVVLPSAGVWNGVIEYDGTPIEFVFQVKGAATAPTVGASAPNAASPTTTETLGVDPICTSDPPCPLHETSLDALVGQGRPVAVLFGTPARCVTRYCGPVLDLLLPLVPAYETVLDVVHVEVYMNSRSNDLVPTIEAWGLESEPWLFGVDAAGKVTRRLDGAFDSAEMRALLDELAATA